VRVLAPAELDGGRLCGGVRGFPAGEPLFGGGASVPGMCGILSGRVAILPRDGLGQTVPVAAFAQLIGAPAEEMTEVVPGEVMAEIAQLSGSPDLTVFDARAVGVGGTFVVPPEELP